MKEPEGTKLFIGQVPREYTESDLRTIFEPYGEIHNLYLLEDKATGQHKGCAFLTYFTNDATEQAQNELHGKKTLPGARMAMQVKPAQSEVSIENRKLFCGMLSKSVTEEELKDMFSPYGTIEHVNILKSQGVSKGCGFVLFQNRQQAHNAIKALHQSQTMEGCSAPMVVKLADSEKDKMTKQMLMQGPTGNAVLSPGGGVASTAGNSQLQQQAMYYQGIFNQLVLPQIMAGNLPPAGTPGAVNALVATLAAQAQTFDQQQSSSVVQQYTTPTQQYTTATGSLVQQYTSVQQPSVPVDNKQEEGPDGANLFIYQIPNEYSDSDLMQLFSPFGNVVSAKVFLDKNTRVSKGFGFVSYDNAGSANNAISAMNGFVIGQKRLRVGLKRKKDSKPY